MNTKVLLIISVICLSILLSGCDYELEQERKINASNLNHKLCEEHKPDWIDDKIDINQMAYRNTQHWQYLNCCWMYLETEDNITFTQDSHCIIIPRQDI